MTSHRIISFPSFRILRLNQKTSFRIFKGILPNHLHNFKNGMSLDFVTLDSTILTHIDAQHLYYFPSYGVHPYIYHEIRQFHTTVTWPILSLQNGFGERNTVCEYTRNLLGYSSHFHSSVFKICIDDQSHVKVKKISMPPKLRLPIIHPVHISPGPIHLFAIISLSVQGFK